jgi:hypothetical protein
MPRRLSVAIVDDDSFDDRRRLAQPGGGAGV